MKKTIKSLVIAASVAAIAGIGAVSFAAWSGATNKEVKNEALSTGTVEAVGFAADSTIANNDKALMPIDQTTINTGSETYFYVATLKTSGTDFTGYKIKVTAAANSGSSVPTGLKYKVTDSAPDTGSVASSSTLSAWDTLGTSSVDIVTSVADNTTYTVYIALDSDNSNYTANAGKSFKITFELYK